MPHRVAPRAPRRLLGAVMLVLALTLLAANAVNGWWPRRSASAPAAPQPASPMPPAPTAPTALGADTGPAPTAPEPPAPPAATSTGGEPLNRDVWTVPARYQGHIIRGRVRHFPDKLLALTFDDGPDPTVTPRVLAALTQHGAHATFFVLGRQARAHPELLRAIVQGGHALGHHSYSHRARYSAAEAADELERTCALIEQAAGLRPTLFRPPYGITDTHLCTLALQRGHAAILWTISSADSRPIGADVIARNVIHTPNPGDIVLMHDGPGHSATAEALPQILGELGAAGFRFVTIPELLQAWDRWLGEQEVSQ